MCKVDPDMGFDGNNVNTPELFKRVQHAEGTALVRLEFTVCNYNAASRCWAVKHRLKIHILLITDPIIGSIDSCRIWIWIYSHTKII